MFETIVNFEKLKELIDKNISTYGQAEPFPHVVFNNVIYNDSIEKIITEFPSPDAQINWRQVKSLDQDGTANQINKMGFSDEYQLGRYTRQLFHEMNSGKFLKMIETLTGIDALLPDPDLQGAGIHQSLRHAVLKIHADFTIHKRINFNRRINLLLYLNKNWDEAWGGHLELWNATMKNCVRRVSPNANTMVIFSTSNASFHGMPDILNCPPDVTRKSLVLYYYTIGNPDRNTQSTLATDWQRRPK